MTKKAKNAKKTRKAASRKPKRPPAQKQNKAREAQGPKTISKVTVPPVSAIRELQPLNKRATPPGGRIQVEKIDGETVLGDLIVAFPWTREVLRKYGLHLDVEEAGDIYMSVDTFAALRNLEPAPLLLELVESSRQPPQPPQTAPALVTASTTS